MRITLLRDGGGDWEAIYFNDELIGQNHSVDLPAALTKIAERSKGMIEVSVVHDYAVDGWCDTSLKDELAQ